MGNKIALITGATSGIGEATARLFAQNQIDLILCGRRENRLEELKQALSKEVQVHCITFDVRDKKAVRESIENLPNNLKQIDILINNAGNAHGLDPIEKGDLDDWDAMVDINVKGLLYVSKYVMPSMVERKEGHIVNIGSVAGKEVYPNGNVYCASKHAVDAITKGMQIDLNPYNIKVTAINPGLVETEFSLVRFKGDKALAEQVYKGFKPLSGGDIADVIFFAINRPSHVNISDLSIFPKAQANATIVNREG